MNRKKDGYLVLALVLLLPVTGSSQTRVSVSHFMVFDWFKSVKLTWRVRADEGSDAVFEIHRSDKQNGPFVLVHEVKLGDETFIDPVAKTYYFVDRKLELGRRYYYKLVLRGTAQAFGPLDGLARRAPPGT